MFAPGMLPIYEGIVRNTFNIDKMKFIRAKYNANTKLFCLIKKNCIVYKLTENGWFPKKTPLSFHYYDVENHETLFVNIFGQKIQKIDTKNQVPIPIDNSDNHSIASSDNVTVETTPTIHNKYIKKQKYKPTYLPSNSTLSNNKIKFPSNNCDNHNNDSNDSNSSNCSNDSNSSNNTNICQSYKMVTINLLHTGIAVNCYNDLENLDNECQNFVEYALLIKFGTILKKLNDTWVYVDSPNNFYFYDKCKFKMWKVCRNKLFEAIKVKYCDVYLFDVNTGIFYICKHNKWYPQSDNRGPTGAIGPMGPTGPGVGDTGPTGPIGPTGQSFAPNFAFVYNNMPETLTQASCPMSIDQAITFNNAGPLVGTTFNGTNSLVLTTTGYYEAKYYVTACPSIGSDFSFKLTKNNIDIPGSAFYTSVYQNSCGQLSGNINFFGTAGSQIKLVNNTNVPVNLLSNTNNKGEYVPQITLGNHSFNQSTINTTSITSTPIEVLTGSACYVSIQLSDGCTITNLVDNQGNTLNQAAISNNGPISVGIWYIDNVLESPFYTVTAFINNEAKVNIEVVELRNTLSDDISLSNIATNTGNGLLPTATISSSISNEFALLAVVTNNNGNQTFTSNNPDFIIDTIPTPASEGQIIAGANLGQHLGPAGAYTLTSNIVGSDFLAVDWAAVLVTIKGIEGPTFQTLPNNASLSLVLLKP